MPARRNRRFRFCPIGGVAKRAVTSFPAACPPPAGHATGRLLLKRPGYEIDIERVIDQARQNGCFFEINSSPDRLDLSAENARKAAAAGVMIAVSTDSHSMGELDLVRCGLDQARRAGLQKANILNGLPWNKLQRRFRR